MTRNQRKRTRNKRGRKIPSTPRIVQSINSLLGNGQSQLQNQIVKLNENAAYGRSQNLRMAVSYLVERSLISSAHVVFLHRKYTHASHADLAAICRGIYETIVNCLYIIDDKSDLRLASFWIRSFKEEIKLNDERIKWMSHSNENIASAAEAEYNAVIDPIDIQKANISEWLGVDIAAMPKWPTLLKRAQEAGDIWAYFYDVRYRSYSSWQHGDLSRIAFSPGFQSNQPNLKERSLTESMHILSWCYDMMYYFAISLNSRVGDDSTGCIIKELRENTQKRLRPYLALYGKEHPSDKEYFEAR
ncbi:DUF5677 domain-containing protein [Sulfuriflexus mobilis]|uniref:DUF5677 domain-containing protein n=1 Tax=Sulfuriflexus mobilis TaxID=1811807 RepID=UPI000F83BE53|nr:DUF5677 domain-containing protein [Sulfuriflexus mobilis]